MAQQGVAYGRQGPEITVQQGVAYGREGTEVAVQQGVALGGVAGTFPEEEDFIPVIILFQ